MTLSRITSTLAAAALGGVVVATTYGAQAADSSAAPPGGSSAHHARVRDVGHFTPPLLHKYGPNGMRLGLHCETVDIS
jgi:hypothetical protein